MALVPHQLATRLADPDADPAEDRSRLRFASGMAGMGVLHFVIPGQFEKAVPGWMPKAKEAVLWSGVAEIGAGVLLAVPRTRKLGGWLATATIVAVYPANIQMAIDATRKGSKLAAAAAWLRLPMQFPMIAKAFRYTR
ncbi:membrane protein [soil metagenome]